MRVLSLTIALTAILSSASGGCLDRLESSPSSFDACRRDVLCFAFIFERVFINFDTSLTAAQITANHEATLTPFPCKNYRDFGLSGLCFDILSLVGDGSEMCVLAGRPVMRKEQDKVDSKGDACTFNAMTNYLRNADTPGTAADGINLAFLSILLFSPTRTPPIAIPSMPLLEQPMVVVRRRESKVSTGVTAAWEAATRPFARGAWLVIITAGTCYVFIVSIVALFRPTPVFGPPRSSAQRAALWAVNVVRNSLGGHVDETNFRERAFEPSRIALRTALVALIAVALVFFEAALVLGGGRAVLTESMGGLSDPELCSWMTLGNSALERSVLAVFNSGREGEKNAIDVQDKDGNFDESRMAEERRWSTCSDFDDCFERLMKATKVKELSRPNKNMHCRKKDVGDATIDFLVLFQKPVLAEFRKKKDEYCKVLEVVDTAETLESFLSGFLFSDRQNGTGGRALRNAMDKKILVARRGQNITRATNVAIGEKIVCPEEATQVRGNLIAFPVIMAVVLPVALALFLTFVFPFLLHLSKLRRRPQQHVIPEVGEDF